MITLPETAILLAAAVIAVALFRFARLSSVLGHVFEADRSAARTPDG